MTLVPYDISKLPRSYKATKILKVLDEFRDSDYECVRVDGWHHKDASSCCSSFKKSIKRYHYDDIGAFIRKGEVYLVKEKK